MRKLAISGEKWEQVVKLRQAKSSWLGIQRETGVPRRTAKKVYEAWEKTQVREELSEARKQVIAEQFSKHLEDLIAIAEMLVDNLPDNVSLDEGRSAVEVIDNIWTIDTHRQSGAEEVIAIIGSNLENRNNLEREQRRKVRRNKLLLDALKAHTQDQLQWQLLDEWQSEWDSAVGIQNQLKEDTKWLVMTILDGQRKDIKKMIFEEAKKDIILRDMVKGVFESVWRSVQGGTPNDAETFIRIHKSGKEKQALYSLYFAKGDSITIVNFSEVNLAQGVQRVCEQAAGSLGKGDLAMRLLDIKIHLAAKTSELEEMLEAVRLRPLILRTRCDLCPA